MVSDLPDVFNDKSTIRMSIGVIFQSGCLTDGFASFLMTKRHDSMLDFAVRGSDLVLQIGDDVCFAENALHCGDPQRFFMVSVLIHRDRSLFITVAAPSVHTPEGTPQDATQRRETIVAGCAMTKEQLYRLKSQSIMKWKIEVPFEKSGLLIDNLYLGPFGALEEIFSPEEMEHFPEYSEEDLLADPRLRALDYEQERKRTASLLASRRLFGGDIGDFLSDHLDTALAIGALFASVVLFFWTRHLKRRIQDAKKRRAARLAVRSPTTVQMIPPVVDATPSPVVQTPGGRNAAESKKKR
eukprot:ANDGO_00293.mRNA.1 hypothetical protein